MVSGAREHHQLDQRLAYLILVEDHQLDKAYPSN